MLLWDGRAPGALGDAEADRPTITQYSASTEHSAVAAVMVFPGCGYDCLATNHEGRQIANWLNAAGLTAFVLKYRLGPRYHHPVELGDAQRAIRLIRARARDFGVLPDKIGVMGFSAGGDLASTAITHFDSGNAQSADPVERAPCRPDFAVLAYPVISFTAEYTHRCSRRNLLGDNPRPELIRELSSELNVTAKVPPTFLFSSSEGHCCSSREQRGVLSLRFTKLVSRRIFIFSQSLLASGARYCCAGSANGKCRSDRRKGSRKTPQRGSSPPDCGRQAFRMTPVELAV